MADQGDTIKNGKNNDAVILDDATLDGEDNTRVTKTTGSEDAEKGEGLRNTLPPKEATKNEEKEFAGHEMVESKQPDKEDKAKAASRKRSYHEAGLVNANPNSENTLSESRETKRVCGQEEQGEQGNGSKAIQGPSSQDNNISITAAQNSGNRELETSGNETGVHRGTARNSARAGRSAVPPSIRISASVGGRMSGVVGQGFISQPNQYDGTMNTACDIHGDDGHKYTALTWFRQGRGGIRNLQLGQRVSFEPVVNQFRYACEVDSVDSVGPN